MKTVKVCSFFVTLTLLLLVWGAPSYAVAPDFLGDFCWSITNATDGTSGILKLGVTEITDFISADHFLLTGIFATTFAESPISGNGELLSDGFFHLTLTRSMFDGQGITHSVIHAVLDINSLNGTFDEAPTFIDATLAASNNPESGYRRADLFLIACP